ncbi:MAG: DUF397 domain-containing protein [Pseudonocardiaceae bacterium]
MITQRPEPAPTAWRASSYSAASGNCVEVTQLATGHHALRDSKNPTGPVLTCTHTQWSAFTTGLRAGEFD